METEASDGGQPQREVGHFKYDVAADSWSWSDGMYAMHGYTPRAVPATTDVLLQHKHPDDRTRAAAVLDTAIRDGGPFSCYHRIVDKHTQVRSILSVGRGIRGEGGQVDRVEGYFVDLTAARRTETEATVQAALTGVAEHRARIDQAKGMVMGATGCDAEAAFDYLRLCSQHANLKLHDVADRLVQAVTPERHGPELVMQLLEQLVVSSKGRTPPFS